MPKLSKSLLTDTDLAPTAAAVATDQGGSCDRSDRRPDRGGPKLRDRTEAFGDLMEARRLVEPLPLTTSDFAVAANRIRNSFRFLVSNETLTETTITWAGPDRNHAVNQQVFSTSRLR